MVIYLEETINLIYSLGQLKKFQEIQMNIKEVKETEDGVKYAIMKD